MRLLLCLVISFVFHSYFLEFGSVELTVPALSVSRQPKSVHLQMRTQGKQQEVISFPSQELPEPPTPPKKRPEAKKALREAAKSPRTPKQKEPERQREASRLKPSQSEYSSDVQKNARLVHHAEYLSNPPPEYPEQARRRRQEGTVTLLVQLDPDGMVRSVEIHQSSGFRLLDSAAEKAIAKWRFTPANVGSKNVSSQVLVPVTYQLKN